MERSSFVQRSKTVVLAGMSVIILAGLLVAVWAGAHAAGTTRGSVSVPRATATPAITPTATVWSDPLAQARDAFKPTNLSIPAIHLDAAVISVGATAAGAMSTPHCASASDPLCSEVYWWDGGVVPGQNGNAVIAGHVNRPDASPASFGHLADLAVGDRITVSTKGGMTLTFVVAHIERVTAYAKGDNNPILQEIFGPAATPNLNLITCIGDWDGATFNQRLIVHTQLVGQSGFPN